MRKKLALCDPVSTKKLLALMFLPVAFVSLGVSFCIGFYQILEMPATYLIDHENQGQFSGIWFVTSYVVRLQVIPALVAISLAMSIFYIAKASISLVKFALFSFGIGISHFILSLGTTAASWFGTGYGYTEQAVVYAAIGSLVWLISHKNKITVRRRGLS